MTNNEDLLVYYAEEKGTLLVNSRISIVAHPIPWNIYTYMYIINRIYILNNALPPKYINAA